MSYDLSDYVDVAERIRIAKDKYPDLTLQTDDPVIQLVDGQTFLIMKAYAYRSASDDRPAIGHAWELFPAKNPALRGSELMTLETSAWGRALAALGIAVSRVASKDEMVAAENRQAVVAPSKREVKAPTEWKSEPVKGTETVIREPGAAPSDKQLAALQNKTTKVGINSDFFANFWRFALAGGIQAGSDPITKGEASTLIGMQLEDFTGYAAAYFAQLIESENEAPF